MNTTKITAILIVAGAGSHLLACGALRGEDDALGVAGSEVKVTNTGSYNLHLEETVRFTPVPAGADPVRGRALFGLAAASDTEDKSQAIFEGPSVAFGGTVVSNQRTCFTCHRGVVVNLGLPPPPLSASVPLTDALFTGLDGDAQGDPDGMANLDLLALVKYRPGRFNLTRSQSDPFRKVLFWRKSIPLINVAFSNGFLNDARMRVIFETARGAVFSHTQSSDGRFDDLFTAQDGADMQAFMFSQISPPELAALLNPSDPMFETLVNDPFYTVPITTDAQRRGKKVFKRECMSCHDMPNVFNALANVEPLGNGETNDQNPVFAPAITRTYNVGVSERNAHGLRFTHDAGGGVFEPVVIPLVKEDGTIVQHTVTFDIGLAATTGRFEDIGRFKVPQLRGVKNLAPYFHDNSAATLADVVDHFNSPQYNNSRDGKKYPIHLTPQERADLLAFLDIL